MTEESLIDRLKTLDRKEILDVLCACDEFCINCSAQMHRRIDNLISEKLGVLSIPENTGEDKDELFWSNPSKSQKSNSRTSNQVHEHESSAMKKRFMEPSEILNSGGLKIPSEPNNGMSEDEKELIRFSEVGRKKDFFYRENVRGKTMNVLQGLELHTGVFNAEEQAEIVNCVYEFQRLGQTGQLKERTYSEPNKWMRGKGRVTIQFGCCYNYAVDKNGNPPGIIRDEDVDPMPSPLKNMIKQMVKWHVLPPSCVPNSCIVNIYDVGDCIPPHIDHHDFVRPFCTVSFLAECKILFGSNLKIVGPGEFSGPVSIPLPLGSVLILSGNGADVAKHCVPAVPARRISITFRRMDESKLPYQYRPDRDLMGLKPMVLSSVPVTSHEPEPKETVHERVVSYKPIWVEREDFPPLGSSSGGRYSRNGGTRRQRNYF